MCSSEPVGTLGIDDAASGLQGHTRFNTIRIAALYVARGKKNLESLLWIKVTPI